MRKFMYLLGIIALIGCVSYLESPDSKWAHPNDQPNMYSTIPSIEDLDTPESTEANSDVSSNEEAQLVSLQLKLEKTELVDGYIVETYREFENYSNEKGEIIKSIPTGHYEYLKYFNE